MNTKFISNQSFEAERLLNVYWSLGHNIYSENGFALLPYRVEGNPKTSYLPKLKGINTSEIVDTLSKFDWINIPTTNTTLLDIASIIKPKLPKSDMLNVNHTKIIEQHWKLIESVFEDYLINLLPEFRKTHININVYWTRYGTLMSYSDPVVKGVSKTANFFLRDDMGISEIAEGILSSLLTSTFIRRQMSWIQRETVIDFLGLDTHLNHILKSFNPTVLHTKQNSHKLNNTMLSDSAHYLSSLGLKKKNSVVEIRNETIYIYNKPSTVNFGITERKFLELLIENTNIPVTYYQLADKVWRNSDDTFSLWALSQLAYKIKNKLRKNKVNPDIIKNVRGVGYIFAPQT